MVTINEMKTLAKNQLLVLVKQDWVKLYDEVTREAVAMGVHPQTVAITAEYQTLVDAFISNIAAINGAGSKAALKTVIKGILDVRADGAEYKRMFGSGDIIS